MTISLKSSDRVFITGKTGSGKTVLSRILTENIKRLVVLDGKGSLSNWGLTEYKQHNKRKLIRGDNIRLRATYSPPTEPAEYWEDVLEAVYEAGDCTLYIDEMYAITPPHSKPSNTLIAIWTRGREFGIGGWAATQRPTFVPLFIISEADHYFMFRLTMEEDRARLASFMTAQVIAPIRDKHGFYYMSADGEIPTYIPKLNLGGKTQK